MIQRLVFPACLFLFVLACASPKPLWVKGDSNLWTLPLVDANGGAELIVEGYIGKKGPYLFLFNPGANYSSIDRDLAESLGLYRGQWYSALNQADITVRSRAYEIGGLRFSDFKLARFGTASFQPGVFDTRGHSIMGVLGGGVLTSTIVVDIDRDDGVIRLSRTGGARIPKDAIALRGRTEGGNLLVPVHINQKQVELRVDLGHPTALWPHTASELQLPSVQIDTSYTDSTGTSKRWMKGARLNSLALGSLATPHDPVVLFWNKGMSEHSSVDGILGGDTLSRYRTIIDRDTKTLWLAPRRDLLSARTPN